jgi:hypothetical protein
MKKLQTELKDKLIFHYELRKLYYWILELENEKDLDLFTLNILSLEKIKTKIKTRPDKKMKTIFYIFEFYTLNGELIYEYTWDKVGNELLTILNF